jgi:hypothetical protein
LFVLTASISEASAVVWARGVTSALCRYRTSALPVSREILDRHAMGLAMEVAYQRSDLLERRRRLMEAWGAFCSKLPVSRKVLPIRR